VDIEEHNNASATYKLGHNKMSDWTSWEYKNILTHQAMPESDKKFNIFNATNSAGIDWRTRGAVTPVKD
jgi:C1A family cysteine protease